MTTTGFPSLWLAYVRLIGRSFAPRELPSLMEAIASSKDERDMIHSLLRDDTQTFIDVTDEARFTFVLDEIDIDPFCQLGARFTRHPGMGAKEMPPIVVQGVW